ncbi:hypothetical protein GALMADRAFT_705752 [Galerina marginata CBS 339.88]|uniref:Uncharacterized protein n=1 Tax=Galerina marginata (strain CBS 339.88) TaxID=685588 RepID=A0A067TWD4_GALM3|nr:hypothetical protein GALMADRAFT_705752 [Galerina marginata CBS 339.88]
MSPPSTSFLALVSSAHVLQIFNCHRSLGITHLLKGTPFSSLHCCLPDPCRPSLFSQFEVPIMESQVIMPTFSSWHVQCKPKVLAMMLPC